MDLSESVRQFVMANLPHEPHPEVLDALDEMGPRSLLTYYLNWRDRFIDAVPRRVLTSPQYDINGRVYERSSVLTKMIRDIEDGKDLTKYLTRRIKVGFDLQKGMRKNLLRRSHLDLLLNEWGIHHLHVSTKVEEDGFVERGRDLLFASFTRDRAFLIDLLDHDNFHDDHLLRVIINAWPHEGLVREISGIRGSRTERETQEGRKETRSAGLSSCYQHEDGRLFVAGAVGISSAGTSTRASVASGRIVRALAEFQHTADDDPSRLSKLFIAQGIEAPERYDFEFSFFAENGFGVIERQTGASIGLGRFV